MHRAAIHIVDDDPDIRDGLAWLFDSRGYSAATWDGGSAFLDSARALQGAWGQAVVLLDVRMAPLSGLVTFERLKALGCPWPVLFLTGNGDVGMAVAAVKNGAWDFLENRFRTTNWWTAWSKPWPLPVRWAMPMQRRAACARHSKA